VTDQPVASNQSAYLDALIQQLESDKQAVLVVVAFNVAAVAFAIDKAFNLPPGKPLHGLQALGLCAGIVLMSLSAAVFFWWFRVLHRQRLYATARYFEHDESAMRQLAEDHAYRGLWRRHAWVYYVGHAMLWSGAAIFVIVTVTFVAFAC
jgi:hypothetical protein